MWDKNFLKKGFIPKLRENEEENIAKLQELLTIREAEIINEKKNLQLTIDENIDSSIEDDLEGEIDESDIDDLKKEMIKDVEG
jgi:hypothetical protein